MFSLIRLRVMFDDTSNKCQWKIKHSSSPETMPGNSPCDHRNQAKDMLKAQEHKAIIQHFQKNYDVRCITLGPDHKMYSSLLLKLWLQLCRDRKDSKDSVVFIEVVVNLFMLGHHEKERAEIRG